MKEKEYDPPILNEAETMVLQLLCRYHMLGRVFNPARAARFCGVPVWIVAGALKSLMNRKLARQKGKHYIPAMQINGAPVPKAEISFQDGIKIIKCPKMYARGYAQRKYL